MTGFFLAIGKQGSGKTLFMVKLLVENAINEIPVFFNITLYVLDYQKITLSDRVKDKNVIKILDKLDQDPDFFNGSIMLIDEIHLDLNSLDFMRKNNRRLQVFFSQLRKRKILLLATSQYLLNVDVRIRRQCKNVFEMTEIKDSVFQVITHEIDGYYSQEISRYYIKLSQYFSYYNTNEIVL